MNNSIITPGDIFGMLTVVTRGSDYCWRNYRYTRWICRCDCGNETLVRDCALKNGNTTSCGCKRIISNKSRPKQVIYSFDDDCVVCSLTYGISFLIDKADYPRVKEYGWSYNRQRDYIFMNQKPQTHLSRFLMDCPAGLEVDHINHNRLDNRRCNLRIATRRENCANTRPTVNCSSGYKGVSFCKQTKKWRAFVTPDGRATTTIGRYDTAEEAALVRDQAVFQLHGEFAWLNFPDKVKKTDAP